MNMLDKNWSSGVSHVQQPQYKTVVDFKYCPVLGTFNNWNTIQFTNNCTSSEEFDEIHKVFRDNIIENMESLVHYGK